MIFSFLKVVTVLASDTSSGTLFQWLITYKKIIWPRWTYWPSVWLVLICDFAVQFLCGKRMMYSRLTTDLVRPSFQLGNRFPIYAPEKIFPGVTTYLGIWTLQISYHFVRSPLYLLHGFGIPNWLGSSGLDCISYMLVHNGFLQGWQNSKMPGRQCPSQLAKDCLICSSPAGTVLRAWSRLSQWPLSLWPSPHRKWVPLWLGLGSATRLCLSHLIVIN